MKILFITGSLEPGRDGVGDYTVRLAAACTRLGHSCRIVALNDAFVSENRLDELVFEEITFPVLRLPGTGSPKGKSLHTQDFVRKFQPDWVSLQFVIYAFHPKGLPLFWIPFFRKIISGYRLHIMFHEVWADYRQDAPVLHRLMGSLQRRVVGWLFHSLKPLVSHTSNTFYQNMLRLNGISTRILPLFGNLRLANNVQSEWLFEIIFGQTGLKITSENRNGHRLFGIFGTLRSEGNPTPVLNAIRSGNSTHTNLILAIGRNPNLAGWQQLAKDYPELHFVSLNEQPEERISAFFQLIDAGINTTNLMALGRSGTFAAMLEHGLPVLASPDFIKIYPQYQVAMPVYEQLFVMKENENLPPDIWQKQPPRSRIPEIAAQFLKDLQG
jgi:hypothetical protein